MSIQSGCIPLARRLLIISSEKFKNCMSLHRLHGPSLIPRPHGTGNKASMAHDCTYADQLYTIEVSPGHLYLNFIKANCISDP